MCSGQSNMAFSVSTPASDEAAEAVIAAAYASDPGASLSGHFVTADATVNQSSSFPSVRFMVVGNKHDCADPIADYAPSPVNTTLTLAQAWRRPSPATVGGAPDVMGGDAPGQMSAVRG